MENKNKNYIVYNRNTGDKVSYHKTEELAERKVAKINNKEPRAYTCKRVK